MNNEELSKCYCEEVEGYMGARAYEGSNSGRNLYGSELSKAIRETLKKCGIKGVTVSCRDNTVKAKFKLANGDVNPWEECKKEMIDIGRKNVNYAGLIIDPETNIIVSSRNFFAWDGEKQKKALEIWANELYERYISGKGFGTIISTGRIEKENCPCFTDKFFERWDALGRVVNSFNYDHSNGMVDYYDKNFYQRFEIIAE